MREAVKRIILRMFPELSGGYHLDRYARILKIADPPTAGSVCNRFRPYWAADIEILTPEGEPAKDFPKYEAVPLPVLSGGQDEGFFLGPRPGTIVTVRWIEGRPDHPVIQHVYPMGLSLPDVPDNMGRWQQRPGVHQFVDPIGNWERKTDKDILDNAENITQTANSSKSENTGEDSTETVGQAKTITAQIFSLLAATVTIKTLNGSISVFPNISNALENIITALEILADHTHPSVGVCSQSSSIHTQTDSATDHNSELRSIQE